MEVKKQRKCQRWTEEEDKILKETVARYGILNGLSIAERKLGKTHRQCRERWENYVDPDISDLPFTAEEDKIIIQKYKEFGNNWVKISKYLSKRSTNQVRGRFNNCLKKRLEEKSTPQSIPQIIQPISQSTELLTQNNDLILLKNLNDASKEKLPDVFLNSYNLLNRE